MIAYTTVGTNYLEEGASFYDHILGLLGAERVMTFDRGYAWAIAPGEPMFSLMEPFNGIDASIGNGSMISLAAATPAVVDKMHALALDLGGADEGPPGERHEGFYAAYFRDLDGNKLCICCIEAPEIESAGQSQKKEYRH